MFTGRVPGRDVPLNTVEYRPEHGLTYWLGVEKSPSSRKPVMPTVAVSHPSKTAKGGAASVSYQRVGQPAAAKKDLNDLPFLRKFGVPPAVLR